MSIVHDPSEAYKIKYYKEPLYSLIMQKINRPGMRILDIGCSVCTDLLCICRDKDVYGYGLDMKLELLQSALKKCRSDEKIFLIQGDGEKLPYRESIFDIIILSETIEHFHNVNKALNEIYRVLKPDGTLFITTPPRYNYVTLIGRLVPPMLKRRLRKLIYYDHCESDGTITLSNGRIVKTHIHEFIPCELRKLLQHRGFRVKKILGGFLEVPIHPLFNRIPSLLSFWKGLNFLISKFPFSAYIKANFLMEVSKDRRFASPGKILIINLGGIGDFLLSTPAVRALKNLYPQARFSILATPRIVQLTEDLTYVDEVIPFNLRNLLNMLFTLRRRKYDILINMRSITSWSGALKMFALVSFIRAKYKVGRDTEGRGLFFDIKIPETDIGTKYEMEYDLDVVKALGSDVTDRSIDLIIHESDYKKVEELLKKENIYNEDIIVGIHPGGVPAHRWPLENFAKALDAISDKLSCKFLITGGRGEEKLFDGLKKLTKAPIINFIGRLDIKKLAVLIKRCNLFISNDTAPMHIAAILKTPLIAIFGPGYIMRFDPQYISDKAVVLHEKADCAPCNKTRCADLRCLKAILPVRVVEVALHCLESDD